MSSVTRSALRPTGFAGVAFDYDVLVVSRFFEHMDRFERVLFLLERWEETRAPV
ncbi:MAG: hypothetical protein KKF41_13025 [Actinobacteria bacterium]|nr:hypothetical protein [Actinomycetota bacterium]MBU1944003.1 hypothetical protein [Actinomycetota bacterium]MBU2688499.1 hypothetical protein [Actinomycetota bacterium]